MKPKSIAGVLYKVDNLNVTAEFYEKLGFRIGNRDDNHLTVYVNWFWVDFILAGAHGANPGNGQFLYVSVDDVDLTYKQLVKIGIKPVNKPQDYENGRREIMLKDPDGYWIVMFQKAKKSK